MLAIGGIAFAIMLIFMHLGFYASVLNSATQISDRFEFDLVIRSPDYNEIASAKTVPLHRLYQARGIPEVKSVHPVYVGRVVFTDPKLGSRLGLLLIGCRPDDIAHIVRDPDVRRNQERLKQPDTALIDRATRPAYGSQAAGRVVELNHRKIEIVGQHSMGFGYTALGAMFLSDQNWIRVVRDRRLADVSVGLVILEPSSDARSVAAKLERILPRDLHVLTRSEFEEAEKEYWTDKTSTGIVFGSGVIMAFIVGNVILYQTLSSQIASLLPELATLRAIGYGEAYLRRVALEQAALLSVVGFVPGLLMATFLYGRLAASVYLLIYMTPTRVIAVFALALTMSMCSGLLVVRKLMAVDPADLFR